MDVISNQLQSSNVNEMFSTNQTISKPNQTVVGSCNPNQKPFGDNYQLLISLLQRLIAQLSGDGDNGKVNLPSGSTPSAPTKPVDIEGDAIIGQSMDGQVLDNSTLVDIGGQSYSIGALKLQADGYNESEFVPQGIIDSVGINLSWGSGSAVGTESFEKYMIAKFPDGLVL